MVLRFRYGAFEKPIITHEMIFARSLYGFFIGGENVR